MSVLHAIKMACAEAVKQVFDKEISVQDILINETKPEFEGDYTLVTFALSKITGRKPDEIADLLGKALMQNNELFKSYNVIKGFLNLEVNPDRYLDYLSNSYSAVDLGKQDAKGQKVMVEYSSPNTNKPLHFGHLRNIFLGYAMSEILLHAGYEVIKANLINDRGIHICKSMLAWQLYAQGATPASTGQKGDHFVGDYYVKFNEVFKAEVESLVLQGMDKEQAEKTAPCLLKAQELLRKWEAGDPETVELWKTMNQWVYDGFKVSYGRLGVNFDKMYYESDTYLLGKDVVLKGLEKKILFQKEDNSVWIDLTDEGLDQKLLLRGDGTSVYITQDVGTAILKYNDFQMDKSIYVIGDEQNYHMQVLSLILKKLDEPCAGGIYHMSYGMVELPSGRMKSREGTVVDADDMMNEMISIAQKNTEELGKVEGFSESELEQLYKTLGMGALKFYLLRVDPKKKMIFNPQESIDFHGFTGPFTQYTHARICSILRKANIDYSRHGRVELTSTEKKLLVALEQFGHIISQSAKENNPSVLCNYVYNIAKDFNSYLVNHSILKAETEDIKKMRLQLSELTKNTIATSLKLLGIEAPDRM
jgi:arginyl-tRNA synthetase